MTHATEKAAPIPADVRKVAEGFCKKHAWHRSYVDVLAADLWSAILADRVSQEERIRQDAEADRAADPRPSAGVEEALLDGGCGYPCGYDCNGACFPALAALPSAESRQDDDPRSDARELMVLCEYDEFARSCGVTSAARTLRIEELRARLRGGAS